jgi:nucleotide-binding universal stress UspA family protein
MMKTMLVPLDGSALAEHVLPYVRLLAPILGMRVCLLQVVGDPDDDSLFAESLAVTYGTADPLAPRERFQHSWMRKLEHADDYLVSHALELRGHGLEVVTEVRSGRAAQVIVEVAAAEHCAMIAMATHGRSGLQRWTLGSVADKVVHAADVPVLVVRGAARPPAQGGEIKRIMVPLDESPFARQALPMATDLAAGMQAELLLVEAIPPSLEPQSGMRPLGRPIPQLAGMVDELCEHATRELDTIAGDLREEQLAVTQLVVTGHAAEVIVDVAAERGADLIVMATHGRSGIRRWVLGSVADKVLHATTTPLVLVRPPEMRRG